MFSIREVAKIQENKKKVKKETFTIILKKMTNRIKEHVTKGEKSAFVNVPSFIVGYPPYDLVFATKYMARQLIRLGFAVSIPKAGQVYVSWKIIPSKQPKKDKKQETFDDVDDLRSLMVIKDTASKLRRKN